MKSLLRSHPRLSFSLAAGLAVAMSFCAGCDSQRGKAANRLQIAAVIANEDQFFRLVELGMKDAATRLDVELNTSNSQGKLDKEVMLVDTDVVRGVDAILISPLSEKASATALKRANDQGIKILTYNANVAADFPVSAVESNQYELGQSTGQVVAKYIDDRLGGKATIATVGFVSLLPDQGGARAKGFLDEMAKLPGVKIVAQQEAWMAPEAADAVNSILTANPELDIVWAANEGGTVGAVTAVKSSGRTGKVVVFGTDVSRQLVDFLLADDNILQAITGQRPFEIGSKAVEAAVDALRGKPVAKKTSLPGLLLTRSQPEEVRQYRQRLEELEKK
jgi:sugar transport system substrate-binding protein